MSHRVLLGFLNIASLISLCSWAQSVPKPIVDALFPASKTQVVQLLLVTDNRVLWDACILRRRCQVGVLSISQGNLEPKDSRELDYAQASELFRELAKAKLLECYGKVDTVTDAQAYVATCKGVKVGDAVMTSGINIHAPKGHLPKAIKTGSQGQFTLFSVQSRRVSFGQRLKENLGDLLSLGMGAAGEWDNHQEILIANEATGKVCADWNFSSNDVLFAAIDISPSGKFVARYLDGRLSVYEVPECS